MCELAKVRLVFGIIVLSQASFEVFSVADVELAAWIFEHVGVKHKC